MDKLNRRPDLPHYTHLPATLLSYCGYMWKEIISVYYVSDIKHVGKYSWAAISLWNNFEVNSGQFPRTEIKWIQRDVDEGWNNFETRQPVLISRHDSPVPHFWGAHSGGLWPQIRTWPRFSYNARTPKFYHPMFTHFKVIVLTNKYTNKQTPLKTSNSLHYATTLGYIIFQM